MSEEKECEGQTNDEYPDVFEPTMLVKPYSSEIHQKKRLTLLSLWEMSIQRKLGSVKSCSWSIGTLQYRLYVYK